MAFTYGWTSKIKRKKKYTRNASTNPAKDNPLTFKIKQTKQDKKKKQRKIKTFLFFEGTTLSNRKKIIPHKKRGRGREREKYEDV